MDMYEWTMVMSDRTVAGKPATFALQKESNQILWSVWRKTNGDPSGASARINVLENER